MMGFGEMLEDGLEGHPLQKYARYITQSSARAAELTSSLLMYSRRQITRKEPFDLNEKVRSLADILYTLASENITLTVQTDDEPLTVNGDSGQIEQVITNLVTNAVDAMPGGGKLSINTGPVEVDPAEAENIGKIEPGRFALLTVGDTGVGINEDIISKIFEPFFTTKEVGQGTGLGLSISYDIITQGHKGKIKVESELGEFTEFWILLPVI